MRGAVCAEHDIPYLGICLGMQMAVVEFARGVLGYTGLIRVNRQKNKISRDRPHARSKGQDTQGRNYAAGRLSV
jgi:CTP synthase (UTP-ammonia lyase)